LSGIVPSAILKELAEDLARRLIEANGEAASAEMLPADAFPRGLIPFIPFGEKNASEGVAAVQTTAHAQTVWDQGMG
jgi:hypothetical protein